MMYYFVELQRAKRALFIALILLGIFLLTVIVLRISVHAGMWSDTLISSPTAHVTRTQLADGSTRIVVDDPQRQTHAVIVKQPNGIVDVEATEPKTAGKHNDNFSMGSMSMNSRDEGNARHTTMHFKPEKPVFDLGGLFLVTIPMGLIVASMLAGALAKENDGHLELAWTKPVSRERYAVASILVDSAAIAISQILTIAVTLLATIMFFVPRFDWPWTVGWHVALAVVAPIAWYALITAVSASLKRGPGAVIGLGWVAAVIIPGVAGALRGAAQVNTIAAWFYAIFKGLSYIDPIAYLSFNGPTHSNFLMPLQPTALVLCALALGYSILAVAQWRRVEA